LRKQETVSYVAVGTSLIGLARLRPPRWSSDEDSGVLSDERFVLCIDAEELGFDHFFDVSVGICRLPLYARLRPLDHAS
jgi:hypothetical protein